MDIDFDLATVINFSTNEAPFLSHCLEEVAHFSNQIVVSICDHFFDGTPEDLALLHSIYHAHPHVQFIQYAWSDKNFYGQHSTYFWHNLTYLPRILHLEFDCEALKFRWR